MAETLVFGVYNFRDKIHPWSVNRKEKLKKTTILIHHYGNKKHKTLT
jgi:hypothetical protein